MKNETILSVKGLKWENNGRRILDIPEFHIQKGEVIALIGSNGAGKSSLLKILALLQKPDSGKIFYNNIRVEGNPLVFRRKMAMIFQEPFLLSGTVFANVAQGLRFRGMKKDEIDKRVRHWLERFGISHLAGRSHRHLSGGEAQRVSLARALAVEPEILFLDESFASLDQPTRYSLLEDVGNIIREKGISAVFVTHHAEELSIFTDRICVMDQGTMIQEGCPEDIFNKPANEITAALAGVENVLEGVAGETENIIFVNGIPIEANTKAIFSGNSPEIHSQNSIGIPSGAAVKLFIRPENILPWDMASGNHFSGIIEKVITLGSQYKLTVNCGFPLIVLVSKGMYGFEQIKPGSSIDLCLSPEKIHVAYPI